GRRGDGPGAQVLATWLERNAVDSLPAGELQRKLDLGRPLRVKLGIDPTAPDIHLGHTVVLQKLREFQDAGHLVVLVIGDFTARIGDPSGRSETRPAISTAQIEHNAGTYQEQAYAILDRERTEIRRNSEWLDMTMEELFRLARSMTASQLCEREGCSSRLRAAISVALPQPSCSLPKGYDSRAVRSDRERAATWQC